jgi:hypothetical protein
MRPIPIPQFTPSSEEEEKLWSRAQDARNAMKNSES